jgi:hypothetical protein
MADREQQTTHRSRRWAAALAVLSLLATLVQITGMSPASAELPTPVVTIDGPVTFTNQGAITVHWGVPLAEGTQAKLVLGDGTGRVIIRYAVAVGQTSDVLDMTRLDNGTITLTAQIQDVSTGELGPAGSGTTTKDTHPGPATISIPTIDASNESAVPFSGTTDNTWAKTFVRVSFTDANGEYLLTGGWPVESGSYSGTADVAHMAAGPITVTTETIRQDWQDGFFYAGPQTSVVVQKTSSPPTAPNPLQPAVAQVTALVKSLVCTLQGLLGTPCASAAKAAVRR